MKNGSLHDHLHKLQSSPLMSSWATRIKVALDDAKGIAKVSEIGHFVKHFVVDKMEHFSDLVEMGTLDYMDPEYTRHLNVQLTTKIDVYCFGVVLLEMLSGYKATDINGNEELQGYIAQNKICKVLDPKVSPPTPFERKAVAHFGSLALDCVCLNGPDRPLMTETVNSLQRALELDACVDPDPEECSLND